MGIETVNKDQASQWKKKDKWSKNIEQCCDEPMVNIIFVAWVIGDVNMRIKYPVVANEMEEGTLAKDRWGWWI